MNAFSCYFQKEAIFFLEILACYIYRTPVSPVYFPGALKGSRL